MAALERLRIGLFLQGDLKGAAAAFEKVTEADPANPDGWVNIGRCAVQEGDMERARTVSRRRYRCLRLWRELTISTLGCYVRKVNIMTLPPACTLFSASIRATALRSTIWRAFFSAAEIH